jgi:hypothetical protein
MKKTLVAAGVVVGFSMGGMAGFAAASSTGTPEIDRASATIQVSVNLTTATCTGEDGIAYETLTGHWKGGETQVLPDPTDYSLTGALTVGSIKWTINMGTGRGVLTGNISLSNATPYSGKLTLITQGIPAAGASVLGRGWIVAAFRSSDEAVPPPNDDSLLANVEFSIGGTGAVGQFGDAAGSGSLGFPDWSVVTNVAPKALDGTC